MQDLYTSLSQNIGEIPWNVYPRPQLVRDKWLNLNGTWDFISDNGNSKILVPFSPESLLSGVKEKIEYTKPYTYKRQFEIPEEWEDQDIILHFGAVNRHAKVLINGREVFIHENGYLPFSINITDYLKPGENELKVEVINDLSTKYPWGKQKEKRGGMWYTPSTGIWQTVWLEPVPKKYIKRLNIETGLDFVDISVDGIDEGTIIFEDKEYSLEKGKAHIEIESPILWSPENPHLYDFKVKTDDDEVSSYFALRTLDIKEDKDGHPRLLLNGKPYFFNGVLDQGYWSDGLYTPATPQGFEDDILAMKDLGFNMLRKHIKVEPEQFYYDSDRLGMIVFQDMVNSGKYSYMRDTVFPTIGILGRNDANLQNDKETRENFIDSMEETVRVLKNHPSIALWTIFNEGWGQFKANEAYEKLKVIDDTRFIDSTSGWFHQDKSDVDSLHVYFRDLKLGDMEDKPQFISEYGGYSYKIPNHSFNLDKTYGYRKYERRTEFVEGVRELFEKQLLPLVPKGLSAAVYTQVSDVEDETNGFLTYDRKISKVKPEELKDISDKINQAIEQVEII